MTAGASALIAAASALLLAAVSADTPASCLYSDIEGSWTFHEGPRNLDSSALCEDFDVVQQVRVTLSYPNVAVDQYDNVGTWTLISNQGFEVTVNGRTYFAFSAYETVGNDTYSLCDQTLPGWSHDVTVRHWSCYYGIKDGSTRRRLSSAKHALPSHKLAETFTADVQEAMVTEINQKQKLWRAKAYKQFEGKTYDELLSMAGGKRSVVTERPQAAPVTMELKQRASYLPKQWDWRNVDGVNYVSPVRDQANCGSCFAFASAAMLESRLRIKTNNTLQPVLSVQDLMGCSVLDQGCSGGFAYLAGGRYGKDYGFVEEECNPYLGVDGACTTNQTCKRYFVSDYSYVGGYYGGGNEVLIQEALVQNGPVAAGFMVYDDFRQYAGGVYKHVETRVDFNPRVPTSHAVLIVGYGVDDASGEKYWIVKNSWGAEWGDSGYFLMLRGVNECGIESNTVEATPIP
ncbi:dipeptidyl peptidase 1-like [Schistocerca nitens]|uniref:dipeptidyl peptidase 1-like n=1 Tax=Schistocerca nitens TaxID=7011 RepID=UPI002118D457|nr:dipeptidyl peptidase 1-like [Schistocerca nitens]